MDGERQVDRVGAERPEPLVGMLGTARRAWPAARAARQGLRPCGRRTPGSRPGSAPISAPRRSGQWPECTTVAASDSTIAIVSRYGSTSSYVGGSAGEPSAAGHIRQCTASEREEQARRRARAGRGGRASDRGRGAPRAAGRRPFTVSPPAKPTSTTDGRTVVRAHPHLVGRPVADVVLELEGAVAVGDEPLGLGDHHPVGEPACGDGVGQRLAQAGEAALMVEVGMGDDDHRDVGGSQSQRRAAPAGSRPAASGSCPCPR